MSARRSGRMCSAGSPICLLAVESHPGMLFYLDNVQSMGAEFDRRHQSRQGLERESRARNAGTAHARRPQRLFTSGRHQLCQGSDRMDAGSMPDEPEHGGEFVFNKRLHEPGEQTVLGKRYPDTGVDQGRAVLADLARHPATAQQLRKSSPPISSPTSRRHARRQARKDFQGQRRRSQGGRQDAGDRRRILDAATDQSSNRPPNGSSACLRLTGAQATLPIGRVIECASRARRAAVAAAGAERLPRHAKRPGSTACRGGWTSPMNLPDGCRNAGSAGAARQRARSAGFGRHARHDRARREPRQALALLVMTPEFLRR